MIDRPRTRTAQLREPARDEWSMRLVEYAMAGLALAAVALLNIR
jgi:hypothetical protein